MRYVNLRFTYLLTYLLIIITHLSHTVRKGVYKEWLALGPGDWRAKIKKFSLKRFGKS